MKQRILFSILHTVTCIVLLSLLSGCRVILHEQNLKTKMITGNQHITLASKAIVNKTNIIIRGQSNLPKGAILQVELKPYDNRANQSKVVNNQVEPETIPVETGQVKTNKKGEFLLVIPRGDGTRRHRLELTFKPNRQSKKTQSIYGSLGENIGKSTGLKTFTNDSKSMKGLFLSTHILKIDEGAAYGDTRNLNASGKFTADYIVH